MALTSRLNSLLQLLGFGKTLSVPGAERKAAPPPAPRIAQEANRPRVKRTLHQLTLENVTHFCARFPCKSCGRTRPRKMVRRVRWAERFAKVSRNG